MNVNFLRKRERKQQRWRRLRKRHLKTVCQKVKLGCVKLYRPYWIHLVQFVNCWQFFLDLNSKRLNRISGKVRENRCLLFTSPRLKTSETLKSTGVKMGHIKVDDNIEKMPGVFWKKNNNNNNNTDSSQSSLDDLDINASQFTASCFT